MLVGIKQHLAERLDEFSVVFLTQNLNDIASMQKILWLQQRTALFVGFKIFNDLRVEFHDDHVLLLVEILNLRDLLILFEMVRKLVEGRYQIRYLFIRTLLAVVPELLEGIHHHDELLQGVDAEGEVLFGNVKAFEILAHLIYDFLALGSFFLDDPDFADDFLGELSGPADLLRHMNIHHRVFVDLLDEVAVDGL